MNESLLALDSERSRAALLHHNLTLAQSTIVEQSAICQEKLDAAKKAREKAAWLSDQLEAAERNLALARRQLDLANNQSSSLNASLCRSVQEVWLSR